MRSGLLFAGRLRCGPESGLFDPFNTNRPILRKIVGVVMVRGLQNELKKTRLGSTLFIEAKPLALLPRNRD
jgi:hypothetical protein